MCCQKKLVDQDHCDAPLWWGFLWQKRGIFFCHISQIAYSLILEIPPSLEDEREDKKSKVHPLFPALCAHLTTTSMQEHDPHVTEKLAAARGLTIKRRSLSCWVVFQDSLHKDLATVLYLQSSALTFPNKIQKLFRGCTVCYFLVFGFISRSRSKVCEMGLKIDYKNVKNDHANVKNDLKSMLTKFQKWPSKSWKRPLNIKMTPKTTPLVSKQPQKWPPKAEITLNLAKKIKEKMSKMTLKNW